MTDKNGGIFISYRREDSAGQAGRLFDKLVEHFGVERVFMDVAGIEPGVDFVESVERQIVACEVLIVVIGRDWLGAAETGGRRRLDEANDFVRLEVATALRRGIRVIPVLVRGGAMPAGDDLPADLASLARRQAIALTHERWESDTDELVKVLQRLLGVPAAATTAGDAKARYGRFLLYAAVAALLLAAAGAWYALRKPAPPAAAPRAGSAPAGEVQGGAQSAPRAAAVEPATRPEAKPDTKPEAKPDSKPEAKPEPGPEAKAEARPQAALVARADAPAPKAEAPAPKAETAAKPAARVAPPRPEPAAKTPAAAPPAPRRAAEVPVAAAPAGTPEVVARAAPSPAAPAAVPALPSAYPKPGDSWTYRFRSMWRNVPERVFVNRVVAVRPGEIRDTLSEAEAGGDDARSFTARPAVIERRAGQAVRQEFTPYLLAFEAAAPGTVWKSLPVPARELEGNWYAEGRVTGRERVSVPAGSFDAIKVEIEGNRPPTLPREFAASELTRVRHEVWFAAAAKRVVKHVRQGYAASGARIDEDTYELVEYHLN